MCIWVLSVDVETIKDSCNINMLHKYQHIIYTIMQVIKIQIRIKNEIYVTLINP